MSAKARPEAVIAAGIALAAALGLSLAMVLTPMGILMPFRAQTPDGVRLSWHLRAWSPAITLALLAVGTAIGVLLWRRTRSRWLRGIVGAAIALHAGAAWLARQNHFEWMYRPLQEPSFTDSRGAHGVAEDDLVLGVAAGDDASAYPVRALAYHHLVNDTVGGRAIVATY